VVRTDAWTILALAAAVGLGAQPARAQPGATARVADNLAPDGFLLVPSLGVSAAHFSQPPDDEGPQWLVGPTFGLFVGWRLHGATIGLAFDHTQAVLHAEEGYETSLADHRVERATVRVGYALRTEHCAVTPSLSLGVLNSDVPFYYDELVGVTGSAALALDWGLSRSVTAGGNLALDLGEAWPQSRTVTSYGVTLTAHLRIHL
jgi:hypothetical protein